MDDDDLDQELMDLMGSSAPASAKPSASRARSKGTKAANKTKRKRKYVFLSHASIHICCRRDSDSEEEGEASDESDFAISSASEDDFDEDFDDDDDDEDDELGAMPEELDPSELIGLTELEREARISEHAEKRQRYLERLVVKKRLQSEQKSKQRRTTRTAATSSRSKANKKLEELKARRSAGRKANLNDALRGADEVDVDQYFHDDDLDDTDAYTRRIRETYSSTDDKRRPDEVRSMILDFKHDFCRCIGQEIVRGRHEWCAFDSRSAGTVDVYHFLQGCGRRCLCSTEFGSRS